MNILKLGEYPETARLEPLPSHAYEKPSDSSSFLPPPSPSGTTDKTADYAETVFAENNDPFASVENLRKRKNLSTSPPQTSASSNSPDPDSSQKVQPSGSSQSKSKPSSKRRKAVPKAPQPAPNFKAALEHALSGKTVDEALDAAGYPKDKRKAYRPMLTKAIREKGSEPTPPADLLEKLEQAIAQLNNNPIQSWTGICKSHHLSAHRFKIRAAEKGFIPLKQGTQLATPQFENERDQVVERLKKGEKFIDIYQEYPELKKRVKPINRPAPVQDFSADSQTRQTNDQADFSSHSSSSSSALPPSPSSAAPSAPVQDFSVGSQTRQMGQQADFSSHSSSSSSALPPSPSFATPSAPVQDFSVGSQTRQMGQQADFSSHSSSSSSALPPSLSFAAPSYADSETLTDEPTQTDSPSKSSSLEDPDFAESVLPWSSIFTTPRDLSFDPASFLKDDPDTSQKTGDLPEDF